MSAASRKKTKRAPKLECGLLDYRLSERTDETAEPEFPHFTHGHNKAVFDTVEGMLRHIHKSRDYGPIVDNLRLCFGSANSMFRADRYVLEHLGLSRLDALFFSLVPEVARYTERTSYGEHPKIGRLKEAASYLVSNFIGMQDEHFYLFCVNHHGKLKERVLLHKGIEDRALFSLNKLMTEVLRADPAAIIVAHNHPRGTLRPSDADILCTEDIINAAAMLGVPLLDHVVVANRTAVSMRDNAFIPERIWLAQDPDNYFLRTWLEDPPPKKEKKPKVLTPEEAAAAAEKERQAIRRKRHKQMEKAQREYRRRTKQAERALKLYRRLWVIETIDTKK